MKKRAQELYFVDSLNNMKNIVNSVGNIELNRDLIVEEIYNLIIKELYGKNNRYSEYILKKIIGNYMLNIKYFNMNINTREIFENVLYFVNINRNITLNRREELIKFIKEYMRYKFYNIFNMKKIILVNIEGKYEIRKNMRLIRIIDKYKDIISVVKYKNEIYVKKYEMFNLYGDNNIGKEYILNSINIDEYYRKYVENMLNI